MNTSDGTPLRKSCRALSQAGIEFSLSNPKFGTETYIQLRIRKSSGASRGARQEWARGGRTPLR